MNYTKSLVGVLAAFATGTCMFGQSSDATVASAGLLGQRYASAGLFVEDFRDSPLDSGLGAQLGVNLPVAANLDAAFSYEYINVDDRLVELDGHSLDATVRAHTVWSSVKPFADATLGYTWLDADSSAFGLDSDEAFWGLGVGVEVPVAPATALLGRVAYSDLFESGSEGAWSVTVGVNHWFTPKLAGSVQITFEEDDAVVYGVGLGLRY